MNGANNDLTVGAENLSSVFKVVQQSAFFLFPIAYVVQNPALAPYHEVESGVKAYHVFSIVLFALSAYRATLKSGLVFLLFVSIGTLGLIVNQIPELSIRYINSLGFAMVFLAAAGSSAVDRNAAKKGAAIAAFFLIFTTLLQLPTIISTAAANIEGRSLYPTLMAGGINIQASTLVILFVFWAGISAVTIAAVLGAVFIVTQSRSIFLALPAVVIDMIGRRRNRGNYVRNSVFAAVAVGLIGLALYLNIIDAQKLIDRFYAIFSGDAGTAGRALLYSVALSSTDCYAFGCGYGSAAILIDQANFFELFEDNFHNVYLQFLVETGLIGLFVYVYMVLAAYKSARSTLKDDGLALAILTTAIMGIVEFNGLEFLTAFLIGMGFSRVQALA